jgi:hypothetical protein
MRAGALLVGFFLSALSSTASGQILYGADQFGAVDLVPRQASSVAGLIESLGAKVDRFEPIADFPPDDPIRVLGRAVGRLDILMTAPDGVRGVANCTATLIDRNKILTNHHCVPGPHGAVIERVLVRFGYLELGSTTSRSFEVDLNPIEANRALDYAVLRVEGDPAGAFGRPAAAFDTRVLPRQSQGGSGRIGAQASMRYAAWKLGLADFRAA